MLLIPGRSKKQGTSLNESKFGEEYLQITSTVEINTDDMKRLGVTEGDSVKLSNAEGETIVQCRERDPEDLPTGMLFMAYGPSSSLLMGSDTAGSGMPLSKMLEVQVEAVK
ncbi:MAG: molybdopterin dinucleotide binding domain-containing protein [Gammaproteobacteria bacterium]